MMGDVQSILEHIWVEILDLPDKDNIDPNISFFEIGGNSMQLAVVCNLARDEFGNTELSLLEFFKHSTLMSLAHYVLASKAGRECDCEVCQ